MPKGYNGKILHVNLTDGKLTVEEPGEAFYRKYMGGSALGMHYVLKEMLAGAEPLGPENVLVLALSVLTGAPISGQSRMTATAKSPLTGAIGDSQCGGFWPAELKFAGFDAIVIKGKSPKPVYLWIKDGQYELRDASQLWGKITGEAEEAIKQELGDDKIEVLQVGPAGEQMVRFAAIMNMSNRANGRTGLGAVMGSKNLKAIAVRGSSKKLDVASKDRLNALAKSGAANVPTSGIAGLAKYGTAETTGVNNTLGTLPTFNYNSGTFEHWKAIDGTTMYDTILRGAADGTVDKNGRDTCYACTVRCKRVAEIKEGPYKVNPFYGGPEYETTSTFGNYCGISDLAAIAKANEYCNQYGMDTISCGATISWAYEAYNEGKLSQSDTGGLDLTWGNAETMVKLTEMIGKREGFGDTLAEGSERAAKNLGRGEEFLITSKGQEAPAHMPQVKKSLAVIYAANPFGADHQSSEHDPAFEGDFPGYTARMGALGIDKQLEAFSLDDQKINYTLKTQWMYSALDSLNLCQFVYGPAWQLYGPADMVETVQAITGWDDVTLDELQTLGERRVNMQRAFNAREGLDRGADKLPEKMFKKALKGGASDGFKIDKDEFEQALTSYYQQSGWDTETGTPTRAKLESLGLDWVADQLKV